MPFQKGNTINSGKRYTEKHRKNISDGNKGKKLSKEHKENLSKSHKGYITPEKTKEKLRQIALERKKRLGYVNSPESIEKMKCIAKKRGNNGNGYKKGHKGLKGENNPAWNNGSSFEPYSSDWTEALKKSIRERDNYICQLSGKYGNCVHHIDYDKKNCNSNNLITLSVSYNSIVNSKRENWTNYFKQRKAV